MINKQDKIAYISRLFDVVFGKMIPHRYVSTWLVILMDLGLAIFSAVLTRYLVSFNFLGGSLVHASIALYPTAIICVLFSFFFIWIFDVHRGVIRYSSFGDTMRIFAALFLGSIAVFLLALLYNRISEKIIFSFSFILIYFFVVYIVMFMFRMFIRWIFLRVGSGSIQRENGQKPTVVFGAGRTGVSTANILPRMAPQYMIRCFFDDDPYLQDKTVMGMKIWNLKDAEKVFAGNKIACLILATHRISAERKNEIFQVCFAHNIKVLTVPPIRLWENDQLKPNQIKEVQIEDLLNRDEIEINQPLIRLELCEKSILITGGAGSIGSEIARQVSEFQPKNIILFDHAETPLYEIENEMREVFPQTQVHIEIGSVLDRKRLEHVMSTYRPHYIFHAAAYKHVPMMERTPYCAIETNVIGTKNVVDLAVIYEVAKFVMISTDKAVRPTNVMGASKRIAEIYIQSLNNHLTKQGGAKTKFVTTRFGNVLGSAGSVIPRFKEQIRNGGPVTVTDKAIERFFMTIPEACRLVLEAGVMGKGGEVFLFDMGKPVKIVNLAERMIQLSGFVPYQEMEIAFTGLRPGEKLYEELLIKNEDSLPTYHEKVFIAKTKPQDYQKVNQAIENLCATSASETEMDLVQRMKELVPEFKSNNSRFEVLDSQS